MLGVRVDATAAALIGMTINLGAYTTEIIRAGIDAVHRSQVEAGQSLGMTTYQIYGHHPSRRRSPRCIRRCAASSS